MRTRTNLAIQVAALSAFVALRLVGLGYLTLAFVMTAIGPLVAATPTIMAASALGRGRLARRAAVPFCVTAGALVVAGACVADDRGSVRQPIPIVYALTGQGTREYDWLWALDVVGWLAVAVFLTGLVWTAVALRTEVPRWAQVAVAALGVAAVVGAVVVEVARRSALPDDADVAEARARTESVGRDVRVALAGANLAGRWLPCPGWTGVSFEVTGDAPTMADSRAKLSALGWLEQTYQPGAHEYWVAERDGHRLVARDGMFTVSSSDCLSVREERGAVLVAEIPSPVR